MHVELEWGGTGCAPRGQWSEAWLRSWWWRSALTFGGRRTKDAIRVVNKWALNPVMLRFAGRRHWYAAVLRHTGRKSGRPRTAPVVAVLWRAGSSSRCPTGKAWTGSRTSGPRTGPG